MVDVTNEIARLKSMMKWPDKAHMKPILERRIYALENEIVYSNPFDEITETLFDLVRSR